MKIVSMFMIVKVPDDFEGTFDDVIRIIDQQPQSNLIAPAQVDPTCNPKMGVMMRDMTVGAWPMFERSLDQGRILTCWCSGQKWNGTDWEKFTIDAPSNPPE